MSCISIGLAAVRLPNSDNSYYAPSTSAPPLLQLSLLCLSFTDGVPTKARDGYSAGPARLQLIYSLELIFYCSLDFFSIYGYFFAFPLGNDVKPLVVAEEENGPMTINLHKICCFNMLDYILICSCFQQC